MELLSRSCQSILTVINGWYILSWAKEVALNSHLREGYMTFYICVHLLVGIIGLFLIKYIPTISICLYIASAGSILAVSVPLCCVPTKLGWKFGIIFQIPSMILMLLVFIATCVFLNSNKQSNPMEWSLEIVIICSIVAMFLEIQFLQISQCMMTSNFTVITPLDFNTSGFDDDLSYSIPSFFMRNNSATILDSQHESNRESHPAVSVIRPALPDVENELQREPFEFSSNEPQASVVEG